jgi:hypothetical protein
VGGLSHEEKRVLENGMPRRIFGPTKDEVRGDWRKLHEKHHNSDSLPNIIATIKSRRMRWARYVAIIG